MNFAPDFVFPHPHHVEEDVASVNFQLRRPSSLLTRIDKVTRHGLYYSFIVDVKLCQVENLAGVTDLRTHFFQLRCLIDIVLHYYIITLSHCRILCGDYDGSISITRDTRRRLRPNTHALPNTLQYRLDQMSSRFIGNHSDLDIQYLNQLRSRNLAWCYKYLSAIDQTNKRSGSIEHTEYGTIDS